MANAEQKQQGDGGRFVGTTWQDLLDLETVDVPEYLRIQNNPDMGDEDLSVDRYISQEFFNKEKEEMWPRVWQMACREEEIPEPGDHHVYWIIDRSVIVTRTPSGEIKGYILVWPSADDARYRRLLSNVKNSFETITGVLETTEGTGGLQEVDALFGLDLR